VSPRRIATPAGGFARIAVIRLSSLGDVVLSLPVVEALKAAWTGAEIVYWTKEEYADAVRFHPAIARVRALERDARRIEDVVSMSAELEECDLIVDLHGNARSRLLTFRQQAPVVRAPSHRLARWRWVRARWTRPRPAPHALARYAAALAPLGLAATGVPALHAGEEAERWAAGWLAANPARARGAVVLCPGARHFTKRWPEQHWRALHASLAGAGRPTWWMSLPAERKAMPALAAAVDADPRAAWVQEPLPRMAALMRHAAAAVSNDSGLMHVAAARGLRVVGLFGSTAPELGFAPSGEGHAVLCRHEPCQPCTLHGRDACPLGHFRCMRELTAGTVEAALARIASA
jgi:ADP-heptose:LPS heptosyltransferase